MKCLAFVPTRQIITNANELILFHFHSVLELRINIPRSAVVDETDFVVGLAWLSQLK